MSTSQFFAAAFSLAFVANAARAQSEPSPGEFIVCNVDPGAYATRYTLERLSDGSRLEVEVAGRGAARPEVAAGTRVRAKGADKAAVVRALMETSAAR